MLQGWTERPAATQEQLHSGRQGCMQHAQQLSAEQPSPKVPSLRPNCFAALMGSSSEWKLARCSGLSRIAVWTTLSIYNLHGGAKLSSDTSTSSYVELWDKRSELMI